MSRNIDTIHGLISPFAWVPVVSTEMQHLVKILLSKSLVNATLTSRAYQLCEHAIQQESIVSTLRVKSLDHFFALGVHREWKRLLLVPSNDHE